MCPSIIFKIFVSIVAADSGKESLKEAPNKPKPEIRHLFKEPEKRPPALVSTAFTGLCLLPFAVMLIAWLRLGVNVSAFSLSLSSLGFHAGMGSIFLLYVYFWLQLDMFTTIKYLLMAGVVTFLCGNSMLVKIADRRKKWGANLRRKSHFFSFKRMIVLAQNKCTAFCWCFL